MSFTFIHTADWQLGRPFRAFDPRIAGLLEEARFEAIDRIGAAARSAGAADVLVAGDVFDAPGLKPAQLMKAMERLRKYSAIRWHLLPGNHDHAQPGGLWHRLASLGVPGNVAIHVEPKPAEIAPGVVLLPAPLTARAETADPTAWMDAHATPPGTIRIGLAHGSVKDFGSSGETSAIRIDPARAERAHLDYLALGDWHGRLRIDQRTWYSGTPEPDRYPENEPGFALVVRIAAPRAPPVVEPVAIARYVWAREARVIASSEDLAGIEARLAARGADFDRLVVRLVLTGSLPLADHVYLASWRDRLAARVLALDAATEHVAVSAAPGDLSMFAASGEISSAAAWLQQIAADRTDARAPAAAGALARLAALLTSDSEAAP